MSNPKKIFIIDFENTNIHGLKAVTPGSTAYIAFTKHANNISLSELADKQNVVWNFVEFPVGNQSADVGIMALVGCIAAKVKAPTEIIILSNDTVYETLVSSFAALHKSLNFSSQPVSVVAQKVKTFEIKLVEPALLVKPAANVPTANASKKAKQAANTQNQATNEKKTYILKAKQIKKLSLQELKKTIISDIASMDQPKAKNELNVCLHEYLSKKDVPAGDRGKIVSVFLKYCQDRNAKVTIMCVLAKNGFGTEKANAVVNKIGELLEPQEVGKGES